jgi:TonB family protein
MRYVSIALLLVASTANATSWQQVGKPDSKGSLLVDAESIALVKGLRRAWIKSVYTTDQTMPKDYQGPVPDVRSYRWESSLVYFNCSKRTIAVSQSFFYGADDKAIGNLHQVLLTFREVPPETPDEQKLETVCNWKLVGDVADPEELKLRMAEAEQAKRAQEEAERVKSPQPGIMPAKISLPVNPDDYYPPGSIHRKEQGLPAVQVCVGPSGELLREPLVTGTSGFPDLDGAAIKVAKAIRYAAGTENGTPLAESCLKFKVKFDLNWERAPARMTRPVNPKDYYPVGSQLRKEEGSPVVLVCVGPSGKLLREPLVTGSSGFPDLDGAAIKVAKDTRYAAGKKNGTELPESCLTFKIKFVR